MACWVAELLRVLCQTGDWLRGEEAVPQASGPSMPVPEQGFHRVVLRGHHSIHDIIEVFQPILLVALRLAGKQEAALGRFDGDAVLPVAVAVGAGGQAGGGAVTVVLVPQERLSFGKGVQRDLEVHEPPLVQSEPAFLEAFRLPRTRLLHVTLLQKVPCKFGYQLSVGGPRKGHL